MYNRSTWNFFESPWDLFVDCEAVAAGLPGADHYMCTLSTVFGIVSGYLGPVICSLGVITNLYVVWWFLRGAKSLTRQNIYLSVIAVGDMSQNIIIGFGWHFVSYGLPYITNGQQFYSIVQSSAPACRSYRILHPFSQTVSHNMLLAASIDRLLCIFAPLKMRHATLKQATIVSIVVIIGSLLSCLPSGIFADIRDTGWLFGCAYTSDGEVILIYNALISGPDIIQLMIILIINLTFLIKIRKYLKDRRSGKLASSSDRKEFSACVVLLLRSLFIFACAFPPGVCYNLVAYYSVVRQYAAVRSNHLIGHIGAELTFVQNTFNIFIYMIQMKSFRNGFLRLFGCKIKDEQAET